jgi:hypothetical protein
MERRAFSGDAAPELKQLQDSVIKALNPIAATALIDGLLITADLTTSFAPVAHKLGRKYQGWIVVGINASATVWEDVNALNQDAFISLRASAACTVKLWVF